MSALPKAIINNTQESVSSSTKRMKAIQTKYNGYHFRSRLEARWAIFFDALGIRYEYEAEGYVLEDGKYYLPDFWLPDLQALVEIKPRDLHLDTGGYLNTEGN